MKSIFKTLWKVVECTDKDCWCGIVGLVEPALNPWGSEYSPYQLDDYIISNGSINKMTAEYIVKLHNDSITGRNKFAEARTKQAKKWAAHYKDIENKKDEKI